MNVTSPIQYGTVLAAAAATATSSQAARTVHQFLMRRR